MTSPANLTCLESLAIEKIEDDHFGGLERIFRGAFSQIEPFAGLEDKEMDAAAKDCLQRTRTGGDGPFIPQASLIARNKEDDALLGAILITLMPKGEATDQEAYHWREPPADDAVEQRNGRPHLTWIFVNPWHIANGVGTTLLHASAAKLRQMGFDELISTMLFGNHQSMLWHWRNGFELLTNPYSIRRMRQEIDKKLSTERKRDVEAGDVEKK